MKRLPQYADAILRIINLQEKDRVWLSAPAEAKHLILALQQKILKAGAFVDLDVHFEESSYHHLTASSLDNIRVMSPVDLALIEHCTKTINLWALTDYVLDYEQVPAENLKASRETMALHNSRLDTISGVGAYYPTPKLAQEAGMKWEKFLDFFFDSVSVDLKGLYDEYRWLEKIINEGKQIRLKSPDTDLTMDISGRPCLADVTYYWNLPDGELFTSPVETGVNGYIRFTDDQVYRNSVTVKDLYLEFKEGHIDYFRATEGEKFFLDLLETDEGAQRLGEIGIGINPKIDRITHNDLFDEKVVGTAHIAIGNGFVEANTQNESAIHWDLVKDLRKEGQILVDDRVVFDSGKWVK